MILPESKIRVLAEALFPSVVMILDSRGAYAYQPDWRYMIAAGNRCQIFQDAASPSAWQFTCEVLDGPHAGVRFESSEAVFVKSLGE